MFNEIVTIRQHLLDYPDGLTQTEISKQLKINRVSLSKYLATMVASSELECRSIGKAKLYTLTKRLPLKSILSQTEDHVIITDGTGKVTQIDERTAALFALQPELMIGKILGEGGTCQFFATDGSPLSARQMAETGSREFMLYNGDHITHFNQKTLPVVLTDGSRGNASILTDITERKRTEKELRESDERYRAIYDQSPIAIELYDATGALVHVNPACLNLFGIKDITAIQNFSLFADPNISDEQKEKLQQRETVQYEGSFDFEKVKTLNLYPTHREGIIWLDVLITPLGNRADSITGFLVQIKDITEHKRVELELLSAYESLKEAHRLAHIGTWDWIIETDTVTWSEELYNITGLDPSLPAPRFAERLSFCTPASWDRISGAVTRALDTGEPYNVELEFIHSDGSIRWITAFGGVKRDESGKVIGLQGTLQDITERKQVEERLRQSEILYRSMLESPQSIIIFSIDRNFRYLGFTANHKETMKAIWGVDIRSGMDMLKVIGYESDRKKAQQNFDRALSGEHFMLTEEYGDEMLGRKTWENTYSPIYDESHQVIGLTVYVIEVTERKLAEEKLRESEAKYRNIIENMQDLVYQTDIKGNLTMVSPVGIRMAGYGSPDELIGKDIARYLYADPNDRERFLKVLTENGAVKDYPLSLVASDGTIRYATASSHFYYDAHGKVLGVEGILHDVTERKQAEEALRQVNNKLNLLSSITRHDINNQLTVILAYLEITKEKPPEPVLAEYLLKVTTAAQSIATLIQFTKEYESIGINAPVWQDASRIIDNVAQAPLGKVMVRNELPDGTEVFADPLIAKVFYNLMDNSVRYGKKITSIRFSVEDRNGDRVVVCEDDGDGIVADDKERIFKRGIGKSSGLGLFLSREILSITGITIKETGEPGKGARFEMTVPKGAWRMKKEDGV